MRLMNRISSLLKASLVLSLSATALFCCDRTRTEEPPTTEEPPPTTESQTSAQTALDDRPGPNAQTELEVVFEELPIPIDTAIAFRRGTTAIHLAFSSIYHTCDELIEEFDGSVEVWPTEEFVFWVDVVNPFPPHDDGALVVGETRFRGERTRMGFGVAEIHEVDTNRGEHTTGLVRIEAHGASLNGPFDALGCGDLGVVDIPARPQDVVVLYGGTQFDMLGATVQERDGEPAVILTTNPHNCEQLPETDFGLELRLGGTAGDTVDVEGFELIGVRVPEYTYMSEQNSPMFTMTAVGPQTGTEAVFRVEHGLHVSGRPLRMFGMINATRCE